MRKIIRKPHSFVVNPNLHEKLKILAAVNGRNVSDEMDEAITAHLDKYYPEELDNIRKSVENGSAK